MTAEIAITDLTHRYDMREILNISSVSFPPGQFTAIVGPSGAGKSTLLRLLNFLERPDAGRLSLDGQPLPVDPPIDVRRRVTTVFQRPILLRRSVLANLAYGLRLRGRAVSRRSLESRLDEIGLAGRGEELAVKLSAGEMQRVALARAMILEPDILLLDEPTANLDPANVALIEKLITADQEKRQTTVVMVTHNLFQARRLADFLLVLINGRISDIGPAEELFERPTNPESAAFLKGELVF